MRNDLGPWEADGKTGNEPVFLEKEDWDNDPFRSKPQASERDPKSTASPKDLKERA